MARPSQSVDQALLSSGLQLYPGCGCAGLSLRKLAEHAGTQPAMVHYHFGSKEGFLRTLLQHIYEELFAQLTASQTADGPALPRLRATLLTLALFLREHRPLLGRLALDAAQGEAVARDFLQANAPRHIGLLLHLLEEARAQGSLRDIAPLQAFTFLMGAINAPVLMVSGAVSLGVAPALVTTHLDEQVLSDAALAERVDLALLALQRPTPEQGVTP